MTLTEAKPENWRRRVTGRNMNVVEFLGWPDKADVGTLLIEKDHGDYVFEAWDHAGKDLWLTRHQYRKQDGNRVTANDWRLIQATSNLLPPKCEDLPKAIKDMFHQEDMKGKKIRLWQADAPLGGVQRGHARTGRIKAAALQDLKDDAQLARADEGQGRINAPSLTRIGERKRPDDFQLMAPFVDMEQHLKFYEPQQRLSRREMPTRQYNDDAIAGLKEWEFHETIDRVNAVTFRLEDRTPAEVISRKGGFQPSVMRTDSGYTNRIADEFTGYMKSRHGREVDRDKIVQMIDRYRDEKQKQKKYIAEEREKFAKQLKAYLPSMTEEYMKINFRKPYEDRETIENVKRRAEVAAADKARLENLKKQEKNFSDIKLAEKERLLREGKLEAEADMLADRAARDKAYYSIDFISSRDFELLDVYLTWMSGLDKEASHLGRMVENEFRKGWISTAYCLDSSLNYALKRPSPTGHWVYVILVPSGFVVPYAEKLDVITWGTPETEVAHFGELQWDRVVGFAHFYNGQIDSPIFFQKRFREKEEAAFKAMHLALSGLLPGQKLPD